MLHHHGWLDLRKLNDFDNALSSSLHESSQIKAEKTADSSSLQEHIWDKNRCCMQDNGCGKENDVASKEDLANLNVALTTVAVDSTQASDEQTPESLQNTVQLPALNKESAAMQQQESSYAYSLARATASAQEQKAVLSKITAAASQLDNSILHSDSQEAGIVSKLSALSTLASGISELNSNLNMLDSSLKELNSRLNKLEGYNFEQAVTHAADTHTDQAVQNVVHPTSNTDEQEANKDDDTTVIHPATKSLSEGCLESVHSKYSAFGTDLEQSRIAHSTQASPDTVQQSASFNLGQQSAALNIAQQSTLEASSHVSASESALSSANLESTDQAKSAQNVALPALQLNQQNELFAAVDDAEKPDIKLVKITTQQGDVTHLNKFLSNIKDHKYIHSPHQSSHWHEHHDFMFNTSENNAVQIEQLMGGWFFDRIQGGISIDATTAALLGIRKYNGFLPRTTIDHFFVPSEVEHLKQCMDNPELGDLLIDSLILIRGDNFGRRFIIQGQILSRAQDGKALKAFGTIAYESSPYAEFLTREIANDGLFIWDKHQQTIISNSSFHELLGYSEDEFPKDLSTLMTLLHPDDNDVLSLQGHILSSPQYGNIYECCARLKRADQKYIWATVRTLVTERDDNGIALKLIGAVTNIDLLQENFDNLKLLMFSDPLTGLHNRTYFHQNQLRYEDPNLSPVSIIFLDVSGLKLTNDILGHNYGDYLLLKTSQMLQNALQVTLTEYNADQKIVDAFIARRTALSTQAEMIGSTLNTNEQLGIAPASAGHTPSQITQNTISDALNAQSHNMNIMHSTVDGSNELAYQDDVSSAYDANVLGSTNRTTNITTISVNYLQNSAQVKTSQQTAFNTLDCLDRPEGCLIKDRDLKESITPILELPDNIFGELEELGVTPISMDDGKQHECNNQNSDSSVGASTDQNRAQSTSSVSANQSSASSVATASQGEKQPKHDVTSLDSSKPNTAILTSETADKDSKTATIDSENTTTRPSTNLDNALQLLEETEFNQGAADNAIGPMNDALADNLGNGASSQGTSSQDEITARLATLQDMKQEITEEALRKQSLEYAPEILRLGGDEFIILFPNCNQEKIRALYHNILQIRELVIDYQEKIPIDQRSVPICFGIGYATVGEEGHNDNFLQAMQRADYRMQNNKDEHHNKHYELLQAFFEAKLKRHVSMRDERRLHILSQKERTKLRQHIQEYQGSESGS